MFPPGMTVTEAMKASSVDLARGSCKGAKSQLSCTEYESARLSAMRLLVEGEAWIKKGLEISPNHHRLQELSKYYEQIFAKPTVKASGGCYVATACYGSYDHPDVLIFRRWRDECLTSCMLGRLLVASYYVLSRPVARHLGRVRWISSIIRKHSLEPLARKLR